jgi:hypothetical protein
MAGSTIHDTRVDIDVSFAKSCPFKVVAFPAQGLNGLIHQR